MSRQIFRQHANFTTEVIIMPKKRENIYKQRNGRWEGRYIRCYDSAGNIIEIITYD